MRQSRSSSRRLMILGFCALLTTMLLDGCSFHPYSPNETAGVLHDENQIMNPQEIGPSAGDLATLDPALVNFTADSNMIRLIFPGLVTLDDSMRPIDWAAKYHEISPDGLMYTFHLQRGMTWSNHTPIDATTFAYSVNRALDPCTGSDVASYLYGLKGAEAFNHVQCPKDADVSATSLVGSSIQTPDPLTLILTLERPTAAFLAALTYPTSYAVPQALITQYGDTWTDHLADNGGFSGNLY